ncbi:serine hydrolase domain-containing protein [Sandaracinobacteroides saxicola]|uniref:Beta-lactamase family protein n=1 Tax=Sandaracinobacteroides saxicola TaxID=2759707 RepID=A0A7G5IF81_9SPHN|nr:serine hydrolase domain-containing protein [Sandaracinobacteroides saxicola]QMW22023.1 beta-lactamase family protein [Sandaracinobacteroides saxicola]
MSISKRPTLFAVIALLCAAAAPAATIPDLAPLVAGQTAAAPELSGLAVAAIDARGRLTARAWGAAERTADGGIARPLQPDTPVRIASISKLAIAVAVLRLVEDGVLDLDRDVSAYLKAPLRNPLAPDVAVTLRMLLGHRSGLSDGARFSVPLGGRWQDILAGEGASRFVAAPGARFEYSNNAWAIIASAMEGATGERFDRLMTRLLFTPLRLDAGFNWSGVAGIARGGALYRKRDAQERWGDRWIAQIDDVRPRQGCFANIAPDAPCALDRYVPGSNGFIFSPAGGLRIGVTDLARLGAALLRPRGKGGLLSPASLDRLFHATPTNAGLPPDDYGGLMLSYGLGMQCLAGNGRPDGDQPLAPRATALCGHLGEAWGLTSGLWIDRARGTVVAYAVTGVARDPAKYPGRRSRFQAWEEAILGALLAR